MLIEPLPAAAPFQAGQPSRPHDGDEQEGEGPQPHPISCLLVDIRVIRVGEDSQRQLSEIILWRGTGVKAGEDRHEPGHGAAGEERCQHRQDREYVREDEGGGAGSLHMSPCMNERLARDTTLRHVALDDIMPLAHAGACNR